MCWIYGEVGLKGVKWDVKVRHCWRRIGMFCMNCREVGRSVTQRRYCEVSDEWRRNLGKESSKLMMQRGFSAIGFELLVYRTVECSQNAIVF